MAHCLFQQNITAVTGELNIRFIAPVPYNANLKLRAWLVSETPPLYELKAELVHDGKIMAQALSSIHENELMRVTTWLPFGSVNQLNVPQLRQSRFPCEYLLVLR